MLGIPGGGKINGLAVPEGDIAGPGGVAVSAEDDDELDTPQVDHPDEGMEEGVDRGKGGGGGGKGRARADPKASVDRGRSGKVNSTIGKHRHRSSSRQHRRGRGVMGSDDEDEE